MHHDPTPTRYTAFAGQRLLISGPSWEVAVATRRAQAEDPSATVLIFDDGDGRQVDFDLRGSDQEIIARLRTQEARTAEQAAAAGAAVDDASDTSASDTSASDAPAADAPVTDIPARGPGRPRLGVVAREVTLLPRHWAYLARQPGGASATLRKLVEAASRQDDGAEAVRAAQAAADRFMAAMLGDQPGYEEAARSLYAGDRPRFIALSQPWPADLRDHARRLAAPAFSAAPRTAAR